MKQLLLLPFFLLASAFVFCQQSATGALPLQPLPKVSPTASGPTLAAKPLGTYDKAVVADTLLPAILAQPCADTLTAYFSDTAFIGFLSGTNPFFDLAKLQRVTLPEATDVTVNTALVAFAVADSSIFDRQVVVDIFSDVGGEAPLGTYLGSSDSLFVRDLLTGGGYTSFPFSTPVTVADASSFIISVDISDLYFDDRDSVDYRGNVAIFSTRFDCGSGNNAFEIFPTANGNSYNTILGNWGGNLEFAIGAIVERDPFVATRTPVADYGIRVAPNPAADLFTLSVASPGGDELTAALLTTDGRVLRQQRVVGPTASTITWRVDDLPAGLYLYQVAGNDGVATGKIVIR